MSANSSGGSQLSGAGTGVHSDGLADDEAILDELADGLAGVGVGDLAHFVGVEPDLALSAADNGRREALLRAEVDPRDIECQCENSGVVLNDGQEVGQRGVVATLHTPIQRYEDPGEVSVAGLVFDCEVLRYWDARFLHFGWSDLSAAVVEVGVAAGIEFVSTISQASVC